MNIMNITLSAFIATAPMAASAQSAMEQLFFIICFTSQVAPDATTSHAFADSMKDIPNLDFALILNECGKDHLSDYSNAMAVQMPALGTMFKQKAAVAYLSDDKPIESSSDYMIELLK